MHIVVATPSSLAPASAPLLPQVAGIQSLLPLSPVDQEPHRTRALRTSIHERKVGWGWDGGRWEMGSLAGSVPSRPVVVH